MRYFLGRTTQVIARIDRMGLSKGIPNIIAQLALVYACSHRSHESNQSSSTLPKRGDRVLIESNAAQFYEARVISDSTPKLRVQAVPSGDTALVQASDIYRLPATISTLAAQSLAICNVDGQRWVGCRITNPEASGALVHDVNEKVYNLPWSHVVSPNPMTEMNLKRLFEKAGELHDFDHEMAKAGPPRLVAGWQPAAGRNILVKLDGSWWLAVVMASKHSKFRVRLAGTDRSVDVERADMAPEPPYPMDVSQKSRQALLRPASTNQPWVTVRLISFDALEAVVEDVSRGRRTVPVRDVCPLENR